MRKLRLFSILGQKLAVLYISNFVQVVLPLFVLLTSSVHLYISDR